MVMSRSLLFWLYSNAERSGGTDPISANRGGLEGIAALHRKPPPTSKRLQHFLHPIHPDDQRL
jgi:hypothetical protein